jgi:hypothetical protein
VLDAIILWLDQVRSVVFWGCVAGLVAIDLAAAAVVMGTRSRALVNRWTGPVLAVNLILIGAGVGVPVVAYATRAVARALAPSLPTESTKGVRPSVPPRRPGLPEGASGASYPADETAH